MFQFVSRRSIPQRKTDDAAFPVRVYLRVPGDGFGRDRDASHKWLADNLGHSEYAVHAGGRHPGSQGLEDRLAVYTRDPDAATALLKALPVLELSDGTDAITYTSPALPFGRR
ncbi:hypothetical protein [Sedimentitalea sp.]|uniref:hypothetical protein n=1 Tax=Sedimentitalea sp. TaxID=2048915 RepID=UPI003299D091